MFEIRHCHYCIVNASANISALFLIRKSIYVVLRRNRSMSSGAVSWELCVLYSGLYSSLVSSLGAAPITVLSSHVAER